MTKGYPLFDWIPGTAIDSKDDVQDVKDTDKINVQGTSNTEDQEYQDVNKIEY